MLIIVCTIHGSARGSCWVGRRSLFIPLAVTAGAAASALLATCSYFLVADLWCVVDEKGLEWETLGQQEVADVIATDG